MFAFLEYLPGPIFNLCSYRYLFLGLETAIHVYSVATSRLLRIIWIGSGDEVVGYRLSFSNHERLYIFTLSGFVSEWDWLSNKQVARWNIKSKILSADISHHLDTADSQSMVISLRTRKDRKGELIATQLNSENPISTLLLETDLKIDGFKIVGNGQAIVVHGGARLFIGNPCSVDSESLKYIWKEIKLSTTITCIDTKQVRSPASAAKRTPEFDLVLGGSDGSILIYHDTLGFFGHQGERQEDRNTAPRRLHWHRDPVTAVCWSKDGWLSLNLF